MARRAVLWKTAIFSPLPTRNLIDPEVRERDRRELSAGATAGVQRE